MTTEKKRERSPMYAFWQELHHHTPLHGEAACSISEQSLMALKLATLTEPGHHNDNPQCGLWRVTLGGHYENGVKQSKFSRPLQIWLCEPDDLSCAVVAPDKYRTGLKIVGKWDCEEIIFADKIAKLWHRCTFLSRSDRDFYEKNGKRWREDPPAPTARGEVAPSPGSQDIPSGTLHEEQRAAQPVAAVGGPGHNVGNLAGFEAMRLELMTEAKDAESHFRRVPISKIEHGHQAENWRDNICKLIKKMDAARKVEKQPHLDAIEAIDGAYFPPIREAQRIGDSIKRLVDDFGVREGTRLRKIAEAEAMKKAEAERARQEAERLAALAANKEIEAERERMEYEDPIAAMTGSLPEFIDVPPAPDRELPFAPIVPDVKLQFGTTARKRTVKASPLTAVIADLAAAAAHLAALHDPDLVALIQKRANAAAKTGVAYPGCKLVGEEQAA